MLQIPDLKQPIEVESPFDFPLDPFQKYAIKAISNNENVLVTAKTGSGKTLVGEFQIHHSLKKGKRVFYTTPIKSLSNQKFHDLKKIFPSVGIMTGDIKFCPQADVVIMTTEILRNLLFKQGSQTEHVGITANLSLDNLDAVVFDEVHYINDSDRGKVWEECLTLLSPQINLVLLSATIGNPETFARWLGDIKQKPIHLLSTEYRIVPLVHQLSDKTVVMDSKDVFDKKAYSDWFDRFYEQENQHRIHKERVAARQKGEDVIKRPETTSSFEDRMNKLISTMDLPALFFVFSRKLCVDLAKRVTHQLIDSSDSASVRHIVSFHLHRYPFLQTSKQYHELVSLLEKGVAYHHSGILPVLKEIVEILFSRGFVKVLFATETFAVGINMPTKAVVFTSYRKYDDKTDSQRMLTTSEYIQMAGRAGRRGKDTKGDVIYLPFRDPEPVLFVEQMMTGKKACINSRMDFHYGHILSTFQSGKNIIHDTYWASEVRDEIARVSAEIKREKESIIILDEDTKHEISEKYRLQEKFSKSVNAEKRKWQGELSKWNNLHFGAKWETACKVFKTNMAIMKNIEWLEDYASRISNFDEKIDEYKQVLVATGYLENGVLTQKGLLASEVHEGHPLLMSHAFVEKLLHDKSAEEIAVNLSVFLEDVRTEEYIQKLPFHTALCVCAKHIADAEIVKSDFSYWSLTSYWAEAVREWIGGDDFVCELFGIEQGNFVRAMLKLSNIVEEWVAMATIMQDTEMVEKMTGIGQKIIRGAVIPDSLYLRI
jgi:superfamily II RNA helicase